MILTVTQPPPPAGRTMAVDSPRGLRTHRPRRAPALRTAAATVNGHGHRGRREVHRSPTGTPPIGLVEGAPRMRNARLTGSVSPYLTGVSGARSDSRTSSPALLGAPADSAAKPRAVGIAHWSRMNTVRGVSRMHTVCGPKADLWADQKQTCGRTKSGPEGGPKPDRNELCL
jgi:hypothetical protein